MRESDAEWDRLRPLMHAGKSAEFEALKARYRAGILGSWGNDEKRSAEQLFAILAELGAERSWSGRGSNSIQPYSGMVSHFELAGLQISRAELGTHACGMAGGVSLLTLLIVWSLVAALADTRNLPGPAAVLIVLIKAIQSGELQTHLLITLARVAASFALAMIIGTAIGIFLGRK